MVLTATTDGIVTAEAAKAKSNRPIIFWQPKLELSYRADLAQTKNSWGFPSALPIVN